MSEKHEIEVRFLSLAPQKKSPKGLFFIVYLNYFPSKEENIILIVFAVALIPIPNHLKINLIPVF